MNKLLLEKKYLIMLQDIFKTNCPKAEIWAYGSRVKGDAHSGSDLDLVVKNFNADEMDILTLKEVIKDSNIPFLVDIFELERLPESFQSEIKSNYVVVYSNE